MQRQVTRGVDEYRDVANAATADAVLGRGRLTVGPAGDRIPSHSPEARESSNDRPPIA